MAESIGNQALRMANTVTRIQNSAALRENADLRSQRMIKEQQNETYTNAWADELTKNPQAKMPDDLPFSVKYSAKLLAAKAHTNFAALDRQRFAKEAETYKRTFNAAQSAVAAYPNDRDYYKPAVLEAFSRARDGRSGYKEISPGKWSYVNNSDGKRYEIDEPNSDEITRFLSVHSDPKAYMARKVKATNDMRNHNDAIVRKGGTSYYGEDGSQGVVYDNYEQNNGGRSKFIVFRDPAGNERVLETPEEKKWFFNNHTSVKDEEAKAKINAAQEKRNRPKVSSTIRWNNQNIKRSEARGMLRSLGQNIFKGNGGALNILAALTAPRADGEALDLSALGGGQGVESLTDQARTMVNSKTATPAKKAEAGKFLKLFNAIFSGGGGGTGKWPGYESSMKTHSGTGAPQTQGIPLK
jgi:hypothetical protein